ncbi:hypothetical protein ACFSVK_03845 [Azorhizophilus paspali]|uniref:hypothetical protein n=1 Tax=Azorhizophilus paspali TaxID=69963 RepID=UPI003625D79F
MHYTLIIHGYSDCSESFEKLKKFLIDKDVGKVDTVLYVDYQSREDSLTLNDVVDGLNDALIAKNLVQQGGNSDHTFSIIVHSTGVWSFATGLQPIMEIRAVLTLVRSRRSSCWLPLTLAPPCPSGQVVSGELG